MYDIYDMLGFLNFFICVTEEHVFQSVGFLKNVYLWSVFSHMHV